jgi:hypothetical protein
MEIKNFQKNLDRNKYNTEYETLRKSNNIIGFPIEINKLNENNFYENVEDSSPRIFNKKKNNNLILHEDQMLRELERINSPININLEDEKNDNEFKKKGSNETIDLNYLVNNINRMQQKIPTIKDFGDALVHRKFDSLHAFYLEKIRLMSKYSNLKFIFEKHKKFY